MAYHHYLYHYDTDRERIPNIPVITMVKVFFLQSIYNLVNDQAEKGIIAKLTTANQIYLGDFIKVQFDLGVLKEIDVGKDQIFSIAQILAKLKTEEIASLISTIKVLSERYTNISDLGSTLDDVENI